MEPSLFFLLDGPSLSLNQFDVKQLLVTGSSGLIGSEVVTFFCREGWEVYGLDNNMRKDFFGPQGDTLWNRDRLQDTFKTFRYREVDVRDRPRVLDIVAEIRPAAIIHTAAQPSHDLAAARPFDDFDVNAGGTLNLLEAARRACSGSAICPHVDQQGVRRCPNRLSLVEQATRWDYADPDYADGISETFRSTTRCIQFLALRKWPPTSWFRNMDAISDAHLLPAGRLPHRSEPLRRRAAWIFELPDQMQPGRPNYKIFGYKGKQVRDNIHSDDVARFMNQFIQAPRTGEVYNLGGGRGNSISILEAFSLISQISGKKMSYEYIDQNRKGDHICYISDLAKMKAHYPKWDITRDLFATFTEIYQSWTQRQRCAASA